MDKQADMELSREPVPPKFVRHSDNSQVCLRLESNQILPHMLAKNYVGTVADALKNPNSTTMSRPRTKEQFAQARKERKAFKRIVRRRYKSIDIATVRNGQPVKRPVGRPRLPMGMLCPKCRDWKVPKSRGPGKTPSWRCAHCDNVRVAGYRRLRKRRWKRLLKKRRSAVGKNSSANVRLKQAQTVEPTPSQVPDTGWSIEI